MKRWLLLGTLGLAVLAGLGLLLTRSPRYEPTGDALYDRYARHVLKQFRWLGFDQLPHKDFPFLPGYVSWRRPYFDRLLIQLFPNYYGSNSTPRTMGCASIDGWQAQFADDPRYDQLRVFCGLQEALLEPPDDWAWGDKYDPGPYVQGLLAGRMDDNSLACLSLRDLYANDDQLCVELLEKQVALEPDNSYWHFQLGLLQQSLGENDLAKAELDACDAAHVDRIAYPFPYSTLFDQRYSRSTATGNKLVRGFIAGRFLTDETQMQDVIRLKERYKEAEAMLLLGDDPAYLDSLLRAAGHLGRSSGATPLTIFVTAVCVHIPVSGFATDVIDGPATKDPELTALLNQSNQVSQQLKSLPAWGQVKGTFKTPFCDFYTPVAGSIFGFQGATSTTQTVPGIPHLRREDWLNFATIFDAEQAFSAGCRPLFDVCNDPPIARIYEQVSEGSYQLPASEP